MRSKAREVIEELELRAAENVAAASTFQAKMASAKDNSTKELLSEIKDDAICNQRSVFAPERKWSASFRRCTKG
jgi:hypothetical protein